MLKVAEWKDKGVKLFILSCLRGLEDGRTDILDCRVDSAAEKFSILNMAKNKLSFLCMDLGTLHFAFAWGRLKPYHCYLDS